MADPTAYERVPTRTSDSTAAPEKPYRHVDRIAELEEALRPFADSYREIRNSPLAMFMQDQYFASMTVSKFTVQDLARAAELIPVRTAE